jgi:CheY-like chemotaxis protein
MKLRILVIDDDEEDGALPVVILQGHGHAVEYTKCGRRGITMTHKHNYDIVLTDILMPETDGLEVICGLRSHPAKLIAMSEDHMHGRACLAMAITLGASGAIVKPVGAEELIHTVSSVARGETRLPNWQPSGLN